MLYHLARGSNYALSSKWEDTCLLSIQSTSETFEDVKVRNAIRIYSREIFQWIIWIRKWNEMKWNEMKWNEEALKIPSKSILKM